MSNDRIAENERLVADVIRGSARTVPSQPIPADAMWPIYLPDPDDLARAIVQALADRSRVHARLTASGIPEELHAKALDILEALHIDDSEGG